ncbi:Nitrogen regulation protein NR(II) [invertebrate metagenome]|uniref:Sensory histidine kinase/phosphatase NtrB n=1 Tax=invertebrate metagenome TaxID=1711999 RepID=A0A2H9TBA0_9ZZZZ
MTQALLLESIRTGIITLDKSLKISYFNTAAAAMLGVSQTKLNKHTFTALVDGTELYDDLMRVQTQKHPLIRREAQIGPNHIDMTITPLNDQDTPDLLLELHLKNRAERIARESALLEKQEIFRIQARGLAHEIKNPLGGIRGAAQLLEKQLSSPGMAEYTSVIIEEVDRLKTVVDTMLGPQTPPQKALVNIHEVLEHCILLINTETQELLTIKRDYDPSIPLINCDRNYVTQALLNILRNAMQAIASLPMSTKASSNQQKKLFLKGMITITSRIDHHFTIGQNCQRLVCHLIIADNGPGIPSHLQEKIFYPMISGKTQGSGLGLPIAQSLLSQHNGLIECDSQPGKTQFHVYLPITSHKPE